MSIRKSMTGLAFIFAFVVVAVFSFHTTPKAGFTNPCCNLYDEYGVKIGQGDQHSNQSLEIMSGPDYWCECYKRDSTCNQNCIYWCLN
jgi:hypothetical protein